MGRHKKVTKGSKKTAPKISLQKGQKAKLANAKSSEPVRRNIKKSILIVEKPKRKQVATNILSKKAEVKLLESDILSTIPIVNDEEDDEEDVEEDVGVVTKKNSRGTPRDMLEQIMFRLPFVPEPLIGTPKQVQRELDSLAKKMQKDPNDNVIFDKIHLYMHGYLINVVLKKFPFIRGLQTVDIYQETLIALRFKAIPNFKRGKGMSFLNFAKMCIRRHLITLLNASKNRKKDQSINRAISLDSSPLSNSSSDEDGRNTYANIISDGKIAVDKEMECNEAYQVTKGTLLNALSEFEQIVLSEYLASSSYREISKNLTKRTNKRHNTKSIDNALLRIRKKAIQLKKYSKFEDLPIFLPKNK